MFPTLNLVTFSSGIKKEVPIKPAPLKNESVDSWEKIFSDSSDPEIARKRAQEIIQYLKRVLELGPAKLIRQTKNCIGGECYVIELPDGLPYLYDHHTKYSNLNFREITLQLLVDLEGNVVPEGNAGLEIRSPRIDLSYTRKEPYNCISLKGQDTHYQHFTYGHSDHTRPMSPEYQQDIAELAKALKRIEIDLFGPTGKPDSPKQLPE